LAQQLDGAHGFRVGDASFVAVDAHIAGVELLDDVSQLSDHGFGAAHDDVVDLLKLLVAHPLAEAAGARQRALNLDGLP